jgi:DUF4097 and DUF4098 domain-containing protein YvlB
MKGRIDWRAMALTAGAALALMPAWAAGADTLQRSFDVAAGGTLRVDTEVGSIDVRTGGGDQVSIRVERDGRDGELLEVQFEQRGNDVEVVAKWPEDKSNRNRRAKVKFRIEVPRRFDLELETSGGSLSVGDLDGTLSAATAGGSLDFGNILGEVDAHTSGGSIELAGGGANVRLNTSGGSIRVGEVAGDLSARTSGGSIRIDGVNGMVDASTSGGSVEARLMSQPTRDCSLSTSGGTVTLYLDPALALDIDAHASAGKVRSDIPVGGKTEDRRRLRGSINGGGPTVRLHSSGGGVRIRTL